MGINILSEQDAVNRIFDTCESADSGAAPFVLVLGSGFSHGLVPMVKEIVNESLPLWMCHRKKKVEFEELKKKPATEKAEMAKDFWKRMVEINSDLKDFSIDPNTGMPNDYSTAYKAAFDSKYIGALGDLKIARKFQRELMRLDKPRLNAAHFLLASILGVQPKISRKSELFKTDAAFSRLILTTNFDPFLQTALQLVNQLYFMTDPTELGEMGVNDLFDAYADAIHLVYVHGSVHRRFQVASEDSILEIKKKNADKLADILKCHGVIVIGYSGWDDAIVEALAKCDSFDHHLIWCGLESDPLTKGAFGPRVPEILNKSTASYVQIKSAGTFMAKLCGKLVKGLPHLLANPIGQVREILEHIDFEELERPEIFNEKEPKISDKSSVENVIAEAKASAIKCLEEIEPTFQSKRKAQKLLSEARLVGSVNNFEDALELYNEALGLPELTPRDRAVLLINKGVANYYLGKIDDALADLTHLINLSDVPGEHLATAFFCRGIAWGNKGETDKELNDYTQVIELPEAPVEHVAQALFNRGNTWGEKGETDKAIADYTRLIELPEAPVELVAQALLNRGVRWGMIGKTDKAIADYTRLIELPEAPVEQVVKALFNRGATWGELGETDKAIADYTRLIELPEAPVELVAQALLNRGVRWGMIGKTDKAIADYTRLIELPEAPVEQVAKALVNRGNTWGELDEIDKTIADYTRLIELPEAPIEIVAQALLNRGFTWNKLDKTDKGIADYTRLIELPEAPVELEVQALTNRGWLYYEQNNFPDFLADTEAALNKVPSCDIAAFNLGLALLACGRDNDALIAYQKACEKFTQSIEELGLEDLLEAQKTWLSQERAEPVIQLLKSFNQEPVLETEG